MREAAGRLCWERTKLAKKRSRLFSIESDNEDVFNWDIIVFGPWGTCYAGGTFKAVLCFPLDYPFAPPTMRFISEIWHPNIGEDGRVRIPILTMPDDDDTSGRFKPEECWSPVQSGEAVIESLVSMLDKPNIDSPANVEAGIMYSTDRAAYTERVRRCVEKSLGRK